MEFFSLNEWFELCVVVKDNFFSYNNCWKELRCYSVLKIMFILCSLWWVFDLGLENIFTEFEKTLGKLGPLHLGVAVRLINIKCKFCWFFLLQISSWVLRWDFKLSTVNFGHFSSMAEMNKVQSCVASLTRLKWEIFYLRY